jgi:hypothetical protein
LDERCKYIARTSVKIYEFLDLGQQLQRRFSVFWLQRTGEIPDEPIVRLKYFDAAERPENFTPQRSIDLVMLFRWYVMITIAERKVLYHGECQYERTKNLCCG